MKKVNIILSAMFILVFCFFASSYAENQSPSDLQKVSVEFRFVCEKPDLNCTKMVLDGAKKEELYLERQLQLSIQDIAKAGLGINEHHELIKQEDKGESLILKGNREKLEPETMIFLTFTEQGSQKLAKITSENLNRRLGIVINEKLIMAPVIREAITGGQVQIAGNFTKDYAKDIVSKINSVIEQQPERKLTKNGFDLFKNHKEDESIVEFNKAIKINPDFMLAYYGRGLAYYHKGEYDQAIQDYNKVVKVYPYASDVYNDLGRVYYKKDNYDEAISNYTKAVKINQINAKAYSNRGMAYYKKGNYDQAISDYNKAIELNPKDAVAYDGRGLAYCKTANYEQALSDCAKAIEINPKLPNAYVNRGLVYIKEGNYDQAITDNDKAIEIKPDNTYAYVNRGYAYYKKANFDKAISDYNKAIEIDTKKPIPYCNRGLAYYRTGQYDKALSDYTMATSLKPTKESYAEFIKDVPAKSPSDVNNVREQIMKLFKEKLNS